jgi:hypothetical protein
MSLNGHNSGATETQLSKKEMSVALYRLFLFRVCQNLILWTLIQRLLKTSRKKNLN